MDDGCSPTVGILIFAGFVILDFVVFGFIAAMQNLNEAAIERLAGEEDRGARLLRRYTDKNERYTHVCELVVLIVHMLLGFLEVPLWRAYFLPEDAGSVMSVLVDVLIFVILILIVLVFGIYTPQKVASRKPEAWALRLAGPVHVVELLFYPIIFLTDGLSNLLARVFGVDPLSDTDDVTEEEIISMVNEGHEQGVLEASEAEMITNIFEFGDKKASDIMTHRNSIIALDSEMLFKDALVQMLQESNSRYPVYEENLDHIIGVLYLKDAMRLHTSDESLNRPIGKVQGLVRKAVFVPETKNIDDLFKSMQSQKNQMVIVMDEYGQTSGLVTMEDILEEIVGNIMDEYDTDENHIREKGNNEYVIEGMTKLEDLEERFGIDFGETEFDTLNGYLISKLDRIPDEHENTEVSACGYRFKILKVEKNVIQSVLVTKLPEAEKKQTTTDENVNLFKKEKVGE
mgnify:CR=1 FL=1